MYVVVLAAGRGSRLKQNKNIPKLFLEIADQTIFEYQLAALEPLVDVGLIDETITVVLGYGFVDYDDTQNRIERYVEVNSSFEYQVVYLDSWKDTENAASARAGVEALDGDDDVLLLCGDIVTTADQFEQIVETFETSFNSSGYSCVGTIEGIQDEMTAIRWDENCQITEYGDIKGHQEAGIFVLNRDHLREACNIWSESSNKWFPIVFPKLPSKPVMINPEEHIEVNTPQHLEAARQRLPFE